MKNVLGWVKSNLIVVISLVVILVAIPAGFIVASGWNKKIKTAREGEAQAALSSLKNTTVTYTVPVVMPGDKPLEVKAVPSKELTEFFAAQRERVKKEVESVIAEATTFNSKGRKPLIDGLFPNPGNTRERDSKLLEFSGAVSGRPDENRPSAYQVMLEAHGAGEKADANKIAASLTDLNQRVRDSNGNRQLTNEEHAALTKQLVDRRIGELRRRAQEVSFFATPTIFAPPSSGQNPSLSNVPIIPGKGIMGLEEAFMTQWDLWVFDDILAAVEHANTSPEGDRLPVEQAPVKRIVSLSTKKMIATGMYPELTQHGGRSSEDEGVEAGETNFPGGVPLDRKISITGRKTDEEANNVYDVREAELTVIVASDRLQTLLSALSQTNFMTVIDLDMMDLDVWADLRDGYYYGSDHVVKATITIETIWLRSWTAPLMPYNLANNLGADLPEEDPVEGE